MNCPPMRAGETLLGFILVIWVSFGVGPWWVGGLSFLAAWVLNLWLYTDIFDDIGEK